MINFGETLKKALKKASETIFDYMKVLNDSDISIRQVNEDGLSSIILKQLVDLKSEDIFVKIKSLDVKESQTGMDFDIWLGENDSSYFRIVCQAKSFRNNTKASDSYVFDKAQCSKLINYSKKNHKAFPMYFLYQHIDECLKNKYFSFLEDFQQAYSGVTITSAHNIKGLFKTNNFSFDYIHSNKISENWKNNIYELFHKKDKCIGLPLYCLYNVAPSSIEQFQRLISNKNNSVGYFYYFAFGEDFPIESHKISAKQIEELYGKNEEKSEVGFKNLVIINDNHKKLRDRIHKLNEIMDK